VVDGRLGGEMEKADDRWQEEAEEAEEVALQEKGEEGEEEEEECPPRR